MVYAQKPAANDELAKGGQIVVTLYGGNASSPSPPTTSTPRPAPPVAPSVASSVGARPIASKLEGPTSQTRRIVMVATKLLEDAHISAHPLDDEISRRTFDEILRGFDDQKLYFYQSDVDEFKRDRYKLDDLLKKGDISFAYTIFNRYLQRLDERIRETKELLELQHDFTVDEEYTIDYETLRNSPEIDSVFAAIQARRASE